MKHTDAMLIAEKLLDELKPFCEGGKAMIAGGLRRGKPDVHDIEIVVKPRMELEKPEFGKKYIRRTLLERALLDLSERGYLYPKMGGEKYKKFKIGNWNEFGLPEPYNPFMLDLFIVTPPAQWGIQLVIRTGPGSEQDNFSRWIVTPRRHGGCLPDGLRVKHVAIWREDQLDEKGEPLPGQTTLLPMPEEAAFLEFLGLGWVEPKNRHARWHKA